MTQTKWIGLLALSTIIVFGANQQAFGWVIDFETFFDEFDVLTDFEEGDIVDAQLVMQIPGAPDGLGVLIAADNFEVGASQTSDASAVPPEYPDLGNLTSDDIALIFNTNASSTPEDTDLLDPFDADDVDFPDLPDNFHPGNVLIIEDDERLASCNATFCGIPDDEGGDGQFIFIFTELVDIISIDVFDKELDEEDPPDNDILLYDDSDMLIASFEVPDTGGDNTYGQVEINVTEVRTMVVEMKSSGAISNIVGEFEPPTGMLKIVKNTIGGDGTFSYESDVPELGNFDIITEDGMGMTAKVNVTGIFNVTEIVPDNWTLTSDTCDDGSPTDMINVSAGEFVTCTFENTADGMLKIVKNTIGGDGTFSYESDVPGLDNFDIITEDGMGMTLKHNVTGIFNVTEIVPDNWTLTSDTCDDGSPTDMINVSAGEFVTCTFVNEADGMLKIVKNTIGGDGNFFFESDVPELSPIFNITTTGGMGMTLKHNVTGIFNVTEIVPDGWTLTSNTCDDGSPTDMINVSAGEFVTCTFVNSAVGMLKIVKNTIGGDDTFSYESNVPGLGNFDIETEDGMGMTFKQNVTGLFNVTEVVPPGWSLLNNTCNDGSPTDMINVSAGEFVTCTFWNAPETGFIKFTKESFDPEETTDEKFTFSSSVPGLEDFELELGEMTVIVEVPLGIYTSEEIEALNPVMWVLVDEFCIDTEGAPSTPDNIVIDVADELVECVFVNDFEMNPGLWIIKQVGGTLPDGQYNFTISDGADGDNFSIITDGGQGIFHFDEIPPGTYEIIELNDEFLKSATCDNGDDPSAVTLEKDEMVTCTFINRDDVVGGQILPIETTALFLAGLSSSAIWIIPTIAGLASLGIVLKTKLARK